MINWGTDVFASSIVNVQRPCGDCHKCCEGTLTADVMGYQMGYGIKCKYLHQTCSIYPVRPAVCRNYICEWKSNNSIPKHFQPNLSNVVMHRGQVQDISVLKIFDFNMERNEEIFKWANDSVSKDRIKHIKHTHTPLSTRLIEVIGISKDEKIKKIIEGDA